MNTELLNGNAVPAQLFSVQVQPEARFARQQGSPPVRLYRAGTRRKKGPKIIDICGKNQAFSSKQLAL